MAIKIIKRISLDFLGETYSDSYLEFNSIALKEYNELRIKSQEIDKKGDDTASFDFLVEQISSRFVGGKIKQGDSLVDVTKDDILDLPGDVILTCIKQLMGETDPK